MTNTYDIGDAPTVSVNFKQGGVDADPAVVKAMFRTPAGSWTTYVYGTDVQLVKDSTGDYSFVVHIPNAASSAGEWRYRFEGLDGSNNPLVSEDGVFRVKKSSRYA